MKLKQYLRSFFDLSPQQGYDLWAPHYESNHNLMHVLDRHLVEHLLGNIDLRDENILDFGCGTGRYWSLLEYGLPTKIIGCDASAKMLSELRRKKPRAEVYQISSEKMPFLEDHTLDLIISTLTIGHLQDLNLYFAEWNRVLKSEGYLIITGNHPSALKQGIQRSFSVGGKSYTIANVIHEIEEVLSISRSLGWEKLDFAEQNIIDDHFSFFRAGRAEKSYHRMYGQPVVYGLLMQKTGRCS